MPTLRTFSLFLLLAMTAFAITIAVPMADAQTLASTASFSGSVSDSSGARVASATATISSPEKGITRTFKTDAEGNFSFALLPASTYTLTVAAPGFRTAKQDGITLEVGQSASQAVTLMIGATEQIEVTAAAPLLQTDNANVGAEISTKQVTELPLNLRNVFNFVELNSSVNNLSQRQTISSGGQQGSADQDASFLNFGGGYFGTNAFLLDGAWDVTSGWGGVIYVPSPDNVQEFKVQQHSFTAQYGWSTGNVLSIVTKSGGSQLHGDIYDYMRNGALDARYYFLDPKAKKPNSHRNQFGVAVGGPVYIPGIYKQRDKTFFFFNFEGHRDHNAGNQAGTVPLPAFKTGDFSALLGPSLGTDCAGNTIFRGQIYDPFGTLPCGARKPIPGNNLAAYTSPFVPGGAGNLINPIGQKLINFYPSPTNCTASNWCGSGLLADYSNEYSGRIDHNFGDNTRLYGRYSYKKEYKDEEAAFYGASDPAGPGQRNPNNRWDIGLGVSHVFSPTLTMSINLGGMKWVEGNDMQSKGFKSSSLGLPSFLDTYSPEFPIISMPTGFQGEGPVAGAGQGAFPRAASSGSVDLVKVHRAHQLSFGYMAVAMDENGGRDYQAGFNFDSVFSGGPTPVSTNAGTGNPFASMLMGVPAGGSSGVAISSVSRNWLHGTYFQDDWKATRKLTLNLGLRYEIQRPVTDRYNRLAWFNYDAINPISSAVGQNYTGELQFASSSHRGLFNTNYKDFAPRLGFAYQLMPKLVMRGGYGVFYPPTYHGGGPAPGFTSVTPYVASNNGGVTANTLSTAFSGGLIPVSGSSLDGLTDVGFSAPAVSPVRKTYYVQQWSYGFQFAPTPSDVIDITYVGNHGAHVHSSGLNLNQLDPKYFSMGSALLNPIANPFSGHITSSSCGGVVPYDLSAATVPQGALLRPHPEFCDITENQDPAGDSHYNAFDVNYTHRVSQGLTLLASYTFSKFIDNVGGPENWASASANFSENIRNVYNLAAEKSVDATDTPHSFVLSYVYELPIGKGRKFGSGMNGVANVIVGGWQTSGTLTMKEGFPLTITQTDTNPFGVGQHVNVVGDYHISHPTPAAWFNTAAFAQAPQFDLGNAPRYFSDLRAPNYKNWDMSIQKYFPINERYRFQFRLDMFNTLNHPNFYSPNTFFGGAGSGFGTITSAWTARQMQAALKLYW